MFPEIHHTRCFPGYYLPCKKECQSQKGSDRGINTAVSKDEETLALKNKLPQATIGWCQSYPHPSRSYQVVHFLQTISVGPKHLTSLLLLSENRSLLKVFWFGKFRKDHLEQTWSWTVGTFHALKSHSACKQTMLKNVSTEDGATGPSGNYKEYKLHEGRDSLLFTPSMNSLPVLRTGFSLNISSTINICEMNKMKEGSIPLSSSLESISTHFLLPLILKSSSFNRNSAVRQ